jgi:hypothetical protein
VAELSSKAFLSNGLIADLGGMPELASLRRYWLAKRGSALAPARASIDATELGRWMSNLMLLDMRAERPRCRVFGSWLADAWGERTGRILDDRVWPAASNDAYLAARRRAVPILLEDDRCWIGGPQHTCELILPLASGGDASAFLLIGLYPAV